MNSTTNSQAFSYERNSDKRRQFIINRNHRVHTAGSMFGRLYYDYDLGTPDAQPEQKVAFKFPSNNLGELGEKLVEQTIRQSTTPVNSQLGELNDDSESRAEEARRLIGEA